LLKVAKFLVGLEKTAFHPTVRLSLSVIKEIFTQ